MTNFEQTIADIRTKIKLAIIDSGIFDQIVTAIEKFIPSTEEANTMFDTATKWFNDNILPSLKSIYDWFTVEGEAGTTGIKTFLDWFQTGAMPAAKKAFEYFEKLGTAEGRAELKKLITDGVKNMASSLMDSVINWITDPSNIVKTLTAALLLLSPAGMFMTAVKLIVGGIIAMIGWEQIKNAFAGWTPIKDIVDGVKDMTEGFSKWFNGFFDIDWGAAVGSVIPGWLKKWLPDSWTGSGTGPTDSEVAEAKNTNTDDAKNPEAEKKKTETETAEADTQKKNAEETAKATSESQTELAMLNSNMQQLIELTKKNTTAVKALNGNIMAG